MKNNQWKVETKELEEQGWEKFQCLETKQPGGTIYTISISGRKLRNKSEVLSRALDKGGVQRILTESRCRRIAKFYSQPNAFLANNIIGTIDSGHFRYQDGYVYLSPEFVNEVIDGQHRLWGFGDDFNIEHVDFDVLLSFIKDADSKTKALLFYKINKEQKKINPSLAFDLLEIIGDESGEDKDVVANIVKQLNVDNTSPFLGMVKIKETDDGTISLANMTTKILKFLKTSMGKKFYVNDELNDDALYRTIETYFNAIRDLFPSEWKNVDTILTKTPGFGAFIELLPDVLTEVARKIGYKVPTKTNLLDILEPLSDFDFRDKDLSSYGGEAGQKGLADVFRKELGMGTFE